jgi:hypothetical protein
LKISEKEDAQKFWVLVPGATKSLVGNALVKDGETFLVEVAGKVEEGEILYHWGVIAAQNNNLTPLQVKTIRQITSEINDFGVALAKHSGSAMTQLDLLKEAPELAELAKTDRKLFDELSTSLINNISSTRLNTAYLSDPRVRHEISDFGTSPVKFALEAKRAEIFWGLAPGTINHVADLKGAMTLEGDGFVETLLEKTTDLLQKIEEKKNLAKT